MATNKEGSKQSGTSNRGFASMDPERQREIASEGGKAAHEKGTAHEFTSEEARRAGSMSHGNRQADQTSTRTGTESAKQGSKQSEEEGRSGRAGGSNPSGGENKGSPGGGNKSR